MRRIARYHLYLGCLFAPLILFYAVTGTWQALNLHRSLKDGSYRAPALLVQLSEVHIRQEWKSSAAETSPRRGGDEISNVLPRKAYAWFSALMAAGLATTSILGIILALQRTAGTRRRVAVASLTGGCLLPLMLLAI